MVQSYELSLSVLVLVQDALVHFSVGSKLKRSQLCHFLYMLHMRGKIADALGWFHFPPGGFLV